jgi:hypothetical protein
MDKKQKTNTKSKKKTYNEKENTMIKHLKESSILGNTLFIGYVLFGIILIIFSIIYYFFQVSNTFWMGISAFLISTIIALLYYTCQRKKVCKIRMIVDLKNI